LLLRSCDGSVDIKEQVPVALAAASHCRLADRLHVGVVIMEPLVALQETAGTTARSDMTATPCDMACDLVTHGGLMTLASVIDHQQSVNMGCSQAPEQAALRTHSPA
jgi:hypothetical protein